MEPKITDCCLTKLGVHLDFDNGTWEAQPADKAHKYLLQRVQYLERVIVDQGAIIRMGVPVHHIETMEKQKKLLQAYLSEFPEHDQGDHRVYEACTSIENVINKVKPYAVPKR